MSEAVLNLHIFYILIYLWYHQPLVCGCGLPISSISVKNHRNSIYLSLKMSTPRRDVSAKRLQTTQSLIPHLLTLHFEDDAKSP
jgi:hypothetical protein